MQPYNQYRFRYRLDGEPEYRNVVLSDRDEAERIYREVSADARVVELWPLQEREVSPWRRMTLSEVAA